MDYIKTIKNTLTNNCDIIGKEKYLNSAVLIPIVSIDEKDFILFQKRSKNVRQPGEVSFPGGHYEVKLDRDFRSTAIRETCEELGVIKSKVKVLGKLGTMVAPMGVMIEAYIGILKINSLNDLAIDTNEVERIFLIPFKYFLENNPEEYYTNIEIHPFTIDENGKRIDHLPVKDLGLPDRYSIPWKRGRHRVLVYKTSEEIIWGMTAELIFELIKKLKVQIDK